MTEIKLTLHESDGKFQALAGANGLVASAPGLTVADAYLAAMRPLVPFMENSDKKLWENMIKHWEGQAVAQ